MTAVRMPLLVALPLTLALSGCGVGLRAQTYQERTVADATNVNIGQVELRNLSILPPSGGRTYPVGADAQAVATVLNNSGHNDRLVSVTTPAAAQVVVTIGGAPASLAVPAGAVSDRSLLLILRGLTAPLSTAQSVMLTFRFERAGEIQVPVPVAVNGRADRPVFTGEPGSAEGEPALGGPTGGHSAGSKE